MKYTVSNNIDEMKWQKIVDNSPVATFYHTPAWTKILCDAFPKWENATFGVEYEDGNCAVFPRLRRSIIGKVHYYWHESTVPGVYGGPIFQSPASSDHYIAINRELSKYKNLLICSNPFLDWHPDGNFTKYETFIQILRLSTDFTQIWKKYSKGRRHTINYARKQGVIVKEVDFLENYQTYYNIYREQLKRWGRSATNYYPMRLFENLAIAAKSNPDIKLWTAWLDDKMISGMVIFYHKRHLATWHGATLDDYFAYRPVDILYSSAIENACLAGLDIFDFTSSGGHENVVFFKERFGAIRLPFTIYQRRNMGGLLFRATRHFRTYLGLCPED